MRFSIIVPVYNVEAYLPACMESLLNQPCQDMEIILVDDGSTDGSTMLCHGYRAAFPEKVRLICQENGGLGAARNTGIAAARGEYLWFVDSDDMIEPDALACLSRHIDRTRGDMYLFGFHYLYGDRREPGEPVGITTKKPTALAQSPELLLQTPSACLRIWHRRLFDDPELRFPGRVWFEDLHTTPKALAACEKIQVIDQRLYIYRQREGSIIHNPNVKRNLEILDALESLTAFFTRRGLMEQYGPWLKCLAVENVCLAAQRVLMADPEADYLPQFVAWLEERFPGYGDNPLLARLGRKKKLVLTLLQRRRYRLLKTIFTLKDGMRRLKRR